MARDTVLRLLIGRADLSELLALSTDYFNEDMVSALSSGVWADDALTCLTDAGAPSQDIDEIARIIENTTESLTDPDLLNKCRQEYSRLYVISGKTAILYPYESAFLHQEEGDEEAPTLFRSSTTLDVEKQMRAAGVQPANRAKEPCDSLIQEFNFLSFLYGSCAASLQEGSEEKTCLYLAQAQKFVDTHVLRWVPRFMEKTIELTESAVYRMIASVALCTCNCLKNSISIQARIAEK